MAATYTRRINLYINGKQVTADIVSIRKEMSKLINEQARMTIGSKEYVKHTAKIKELKTIIDNHNQDLSTTHKKWNTFQKMADAANRYFAVITAGIAAIAGAVATIKGTVTAFAEFDDKLVDVMKTTNLTKQQTIELSAELKKINTRTAQLDLLELARVAGKLGIRGREDVLGFVRATDKIRVALSEDLGGDTEESVRQLGKLVDIFKLTNEFSVEESLLKIGSAMNALGASGTANEGYMLEFTKRVAGVAPTAGISIDKILGLATTLDELGQTSEVSSTAFNQVISNMFKKTGDYARIAGMELQDFTDLMNKDANEALIQLLIGAKGSSDGFGQLANSLSELGMDGVRATTVLGVLASNIDKLRENQKYSNEEFIKGNSLLIEFNKKNNSAQAQLEKAFKRFKEIQVELGKELTPIFAQSIHKASTLLKVFGTTVEFLFKYGKSLLVLTTIIAAHTLAVKALAMWEARKNAAVGIGLVVSKLQTAAFAAQFAAISLYNAGVALLAGNTALATTSLRAFSVALNATPIGWITTGITALYFAIKTYDSENAKSVARENEKTAALKDLKLLTEGYSDSLNNLNKSISESNTLTLQQKILRKQETDELINHLEYEIKRQELAQNNIRLKFTEATLLQKTINIFKSAANPYLATSLNAIDAAKNGADAAASFNDGISELKSTLVETKQAASGFYAIVNAEAQGDKIGSESLVMMNEKLGKYRIALENAVFGGEDYLRIQGKIIALQKTIDSRPLTSPKTEEEKETKKVKEQQEKEETPVKKLKASFEQEQALIRQNYLQGLSNEDEFNQQMLLSELKFLDDKLKVYKVGSSKYQEAVNESLELQVKVDEKLKDLQLKAEQELAEAKIENFRDEFKRQEEAEIVRWDIEKTALEKRLIDKTDLNEKELAINAAIHELIEEKEKAHQAKMTDLKTGQKLSDLQNIADASTPFDAQFAELDELQKMYDAKNALIKAQYENEKTLADKNKAALLAADKHYNDAVLQLKLEMIDAEWAQKEQRVAAGQEFITALSGMVEEESALGKALFLFNQGLAVAEIWINIAKANAKAVAASPLTAGMPWVGINSAIGAAQTALIVSQTVKSFSAPSKDNGYSEGGPTPPGGKNEPAGIVHKGEYVVPQFMKADPQVRYITDVFEKMRTRKISLSQAAMPLLASKGFASGGYSSGNQITMPEITITPPNSSLIEEQNKINKELTQAIIELTKYRPALAIEAFEREREKYVRIKQTNGL